MLPRILVVGDVMLDCLQEGTCDRISPEAPVPVLKLVGTSFFPGGAANVAVSLQKLGFPVKLLGIIGNDAAGQTLINCLQDAKSLSYQLPYDPTAPTICKTRYRAGAQQLFRVDQEQPFTLSDEIRLAFLEQIFQQPYAAIVISDYGKGSVSDAVLRYLEDQRQLLQLPVFVDAKDYSRYGPGGLLQPTLIKPNYQEALGYVRQQPSLPVEFELGLRGHAGGELLAAELLVVSPCVVVTLGAEGMAMALQEDHARHLRSEPGRSADCRDVCGAGDTSLATLVASLVPTCGNRISWVELQRAVSRANLAAALKVERVGTYQPDWVEIFLQQLQSCKYSQESQTFISAAVRWLQGRGKTVVFTNGVFDLYHPGHEQLLELAKCEGDFLIVAVNEDESVRRLKGDSRPLIPFENRVQVLARNPNVDLVIGFREDTPESLIRVLSPDVLVKGDQYQGGRIPGEDYIASLGGRTKLVSMLPGWSTTDLKNSSS